MTGVRPQSDDRGEAPFYSTFYCIISPLHLMSRDSISLHDLIVLFKYKKFKDNLRTHKDTKLLINAAAVKLTSKTVYGHLRKILHSTIQKPRHQY